MRTNCPQQRLVRGIPCCHAQPLALPTLSIQMKGSPHRPHGNAWHLQHQTSVRERRNALLPLVSSAVFLHLGPSASFSTPSPHHGSFDQHFHSTSFCGLLPFSLVSCVPSGSSPAPARRPCIRNSFFPRLGRSLCRLVLLSCNCIYPSPWRLHQTTGLHPCRLPLFYSSAWLLLGFSHPCSSSRPRQLPTLPLYLRKILTQPKCTETPPHGRRLTQSHLQPCHVGSQDDGSLGLFLLSFFFRIMGRTWEQPAASIRSRQEAKEERSKEVL